MEGLTEGLTLGDVLGLIEGLILGDTEGLGEGEIELMGSL